MPDRLLELIAAEPSSFRAEFKSEMSRVETRLAWIEERLDRLVETVAGMRFQMAGMVHTR